VDLPDEDRQADFYDLAADFLVSTGYEHYEISNFCRPDRACRHNLCYWQCDDYLGIGPAAHGRIGRRYTANADSLATYVARVRTHGRGAVRAETWSDERLRQERIIQGLRLSRGVPLDWLSDEERAALSAIRHAGLIEVGEDRLALTRRGRLLANEVFALFIP